MLSFEVAGTTVKIYWAVALVLIVLVYVAVSLIKWVKLKSLIHRFEVGDSDAELMKAIEAQKKFYRAGNRNTVVVHDLLCCITAALALVHGDEITFVSNLHQIKAVTGDTEHRVRLLMAAYLTGCEYLELSKEYARRSPEGRGNQDVLLAMYREYATKGNERADALRVMLARNEKKSSQFCAK